MRVHRFIGCQYRVQLNDRRVHAVWPTHRNWLISERRILDSCNWPQYTTMPLHDLGLVPSSNASFAASCDMFQQSYEQCLSLTSHRAATCDTWTNQRSMRDAAVNGHSFADWLQPVEWINNNSVHFGNHYTTTADSYATRPPYSYISMIAMAIENSPDNRYAYYIYTYIGLGFHSKMELFVSL